MPLYLAAQGSVEDLSMKDDQTLDLGMAHLSSDPSATLDMHSYISYCTAFAMAYL